MNKTGTGIVRVCRTLFTNKPRVQPKPIRDSFAVYLRKQDGQWQLRRMIPLRDAGWPPESSANHLDPPIMNLARRPVPPPL